MMRLDLDGDALTVTLSGDIDATTAYQPYEAAVAAFEEHQIRSVIIDLGGVTFADSTALGSLVRIRELADQRSAPCRLRNVPPTLRSLLNMTGLDQALEII